MGQLQCNVIYYTLKYQCITITITITITNTSVFLIT